MKKRLAKQIAKLWNENFAGTYEPTKTQAIVCEDTVRIFPVGGNNGHSFHSHKEVADVERSFKVSSYIAQDENHRLYAVFF